MAKLGRPKGTRGTTWVWRNPANVAAHHASTLFELWLEDATVFAAATLLNLTPTESAECRLLIECWHDRGNGKRHDVPPEIEKTLCLLAIAHVVRLHRQTQDAKPEIRAIFRRAAQAAEAKLKAEGWSDEQVAARFNSIAPKRSAKRFMTPSVEQVLGIVARRAPPGTLRWRKKAAAPDSPEAALREYEERLQSAWRADPEIPTAKSRKKARDRAQAKARRAALGAKSRAASATRPWEAEGISRRTWERRRKAQRPL
jgi:hypothetical protein